MEAGKHNIKELFQKDVRYVIPTFQRPYVWNQEKQWEPLWDDVRNIAEEYAEKLAEEGSHADAEAKAGTHFLGAIVLQQEHTPTAEIDRRNVIDGQQRMTTLQILLDAAQEVLEEEGFEREAKRLGKLVLNDEDFAEGDVRFKLWPTSGDQGAFRAAMTNGNATTEFATSLIVQAHEFFTFQIREWLKSAELRMRAQLAEALHTALIGLLILVVIDLKSGDDAYVIFETLNARGTPLLASDLVKNFILQSASEKGYDTDNLHKTYWAEFEKKWWREDVQQGRITRPRIDVFLNYWLTARRFEEVASYNVFPLFKDYVATTLDNKDKKTDLTDIARDIHHHGETYRRLEETNGHTPEEQTFLYRWQTMQAGVVTPLLLELFSADVSLLAQGKRERALRALESFLVRRTVCRMTTKDYNRLTQELLSRLAGKIGNADGVIVEFLASQTAESREWPSNEKVIQAMLDLPLYRLLTRGRMRMILEGVEEKMRTPKAEEPQVKRGKLTIEHILPQEWTAHWPLEPLAMAENPDEYHRRYETRERMKHTIGNLTLVNNKLNPALSNTHWKGKQEELNKHSTLFLNKDLLAKWSAASFEETQIRERSLELANLAIQVWPGPGKL
ncbi:MAG: DUF262 domain-containing protein [Candidatus Promineofilum sp.]|nr:DUF262 domain-containing protein [Promineifilum sp.]